LWLLKCGRSLQCRRAKKAAIRSRLALSALASNSKAGVSTAAKGVKTEDCSVMGRDYISGLVPGPSVILQDRFKWAHSRVLGSRGVNEVAAAVLLRCRSGLLSAWSSACEFGTRRGEGGQALTCEAEAQNWRRLIARPEGQPIVILERGLEREHVGQAGRFPELAGAFDAGLELTAG